MQCTDTSGHFSVQGALTCMMGQVEAISTHVDDWVEQV